MEFSQIQKYAEAVGWKVENGIGCYVLTTDTGTLINKSLTPIRTRLAAKYRELAEQEDRLFRTELRLLGKSAPDDDRTFRYSWFKKAADSLSEPEEPTMLERLEDAKRKCSQFDTEFVILDALIALYKAKE